MERNTPVSPFFPAPHVSASASENTAFRGHTEQSRESGGTDPRANRPRSSKAFTHSFLSSETSGICILYQKTTPPPGRSPHLPSCLSPIHLFKSQIGSFTPSLKCFIFSKKTKAGPEGMAPTYLPNFPLGAALQPDQRPFVCPGHSSFSTSLLLLCFHQVLCSSFRPQLELRRLPCLPD